jgi:hypothetical protein
MHGPNIGTQALDSLYWPQSSAFPMSMKIVGLSLSSAKRIRPTFLRVVTFDRD